MTSGCSDRRGDIGGYVLGGLEPDEVADLEQHLDACAACRAEVADLAGLPRLLAAAADAPRPAPADLRPRTLSAIRPRSRPRMVAALVLVTALGTATIVGLGALQDRPPGTSVAIAAAPGVPPVSGEARLAQVDSGVRITLAMAGLHPAEDGYYHAWLTRGDVRASAGTFVADPAGRAEAILQCGGRLADYDDLVVTWHPRDRGGEVVAVRSPLAD